MKIAVVNDVLKEDLKAKHLLNTTTIDALFNSSLSSSVDITKLVTEYNDRIVDTLVIQDGEKQHTNNLTAIHLSNNGHIIINYLSNTNESFTKVYTHIVEASFEFIKDKKILFYSENLNCIFIRLRDSIVLLNLINFKRYNKIIEREMDAESELFVVENDSYVVLSYAVNKVIKMFLWNAQTGRYLRLATVDLKKLKKYLKNARIQDISFLASPDNDKLLILFETEILVYDLSAGKLLTNKPSLSIKRLKHLPSDITVLLDDTDLSSHNKDVGYSKDKSAFRFVSFIADNSRDIKDNSDNRDNKDIKDNSDNKYIKDTVLVDNHGNLYRVVFDGTKNVTILLYDTILFRGNSDKTISKIEYETGDEPYNGATTLFVYSDSNKTLDICYNNYSIITLDVTSQVLNKDFLVKFDEINKKMVVSKLNYNEVLHIDMLAMNPMNLINLINKIYYSKEGNMSDQVYLDMIRSAYSKLIIMSKTIAQNNPSVLSFLNEQAIKYLLPLDVVTALNSGTCNRLFVNYLVEVKRYLLNILHGSASKYNIFFNNKIIVNDFSFFIYNDESDADSELSAEDLLKSIDEKLFFNYLKTDLKMLELFITPENSKCNVDEKTILDSLIDLLKKQKQDSISVLKLIIKYTIFTAQYETGLDIVNNLSSYLNVELPDGYTDQLLRSYLIEAFPKIASESDSSSLGVFFRYLKKIPNHTSSSILSSILLQEKPFVFNDTLFSELLGNIETLNKKMPVVFLEYYSLKSGSDKVINSLISLYINENCDENLDKLYELLSSNSDKYDPFEVFTLLHNANYGKSATEEPSSLNSCKILLWKQLRDDHNVLNYYYNEKKLLSACFEYINGFRDDDCVRFKENIQKLYELLASNATEYTTDYNHWLLFLQEYDEHVSLEQIPDFITISDVQTILLGHMTKPLHVTAQLNGLFLAQSKVAFTQEKYKYNQFINQFEEES